MTMTDPIADMLARIRNATVAQQDTIRMPSSKVKAGIADILKREGYIKEHCRAHFWRLIIDEAGKLASPAELYPCAWPPSCQACKDGVPH